MALDSALFNVINGLATQVPLVDALMRLLVNDYFVPIVLGSLTVALWFAGGTREERERNQRVVLTTIVAVLLVNVLVELSNRVYFRPRPFSVQQVNLLFYRPWDSSFPSNSAAVAFTFAGVVWLRHRWLGVVMGVLAGLWGFARIYCGVHYPLDVVVGGLTGAVCAYVVGKGQRLLEPFTAAIIGVGRRLYLA